MSQESKNNAVNSIVEQYQRAFREHGDTPASVLWPRGRQELRFDALTRHIRQDGFSILDYGCGLGHLKSYLDQRFDCVSYFGVDLVPDFVDAVKAKYPSAKMKLVSSFEDVSEAVDHVIVSGTFNLVVGDDVSAYLETVKKTLLHLFSLCRVSMSVNFMTDKVDFQQAGAHHVNVEGMFRFLSGNLSSRLLIDHSYMPYEFTCVVFKDDGIVRPDNIYRAL
ncbi:class I SAM-dependent methyltransferase [Pseudomonas fluorescens]|uniref:class I SAM-dependent methyltransferase n=1 Tax=Pseudomonas fluorescens TaxID=294 RepID=UPI00125B7AA1|nr:class I SAM-dependent methyltransferase [Pseudomonas fluorescens]VVN26814.1 hypothetical protein PS676_04604 [Pseudomonas fluorescens]